MCRPTKAKCQARSSANASTANQMLARHCQDCPLYANSSLCRQDQVNQISFYQSFGESHCSKNLGSTCTHHMGSFCACGQPSRSQPKPRKQKILTPYNFTYVNLQESKNSSQAEALSSLIKRSKQLQHSPTKRTARASCDASLREPTSIHSPKSALLNGPGCVSYGQQTQIVPDSVEVSSQD